MDLPEDEALHNCAFVSTELSLTKGSETHNTDILVTPRIGVSIPLECQGSICFICFLPRALRGVGAEGGRGLEEDGDQENREAIDGEVDVEVPMPRDVVRERTADEWADNRDEPEDGAKRQGASAGPPAG